MDTHFSPPWASLRYSDLPQSRSKGVKTLEHLTALSSAYPAGATAMAPRVNEKISQDKGSPAQPSTAWLADLWTQVPPQ